MPARFNSRLENNSESSISVVQRYRKVMMQNVFDENLALVHYRGGEEEFQIGKSYLNSKDPTDRAVGADILAQLGWQDRTYLDESLGILIPALKDENELVVCSVCYALGHRSDPRAIPHVLTLAQSPSEKIRCGVVSALLGQESEDAIDAMIILSKDSNQDVRNWAMFGLGSQIEANSAEVREALFVGTSDTHSEIRGEALLGLAERKDDRIVDLLLREWENYDYVSILSLEAAEKTESSRLYSALLNFKKTMDLEGGERFFSQLQCAIDACQPKIE